MKCENTNITYQDVLNYSRYDDLNRIIDVPEFLLHKHNEANKDLIKDMKAIPIVVLAFLYLTLIVLLMPLIIFVGLPINYLYSKIKGRN
jgi:hypothetical protein